MWISVVGRPALIWREGETEKNQENLQETQSPKTHKLPSSIVAYPTGFVGCLQAIDPLCATCYDRLETI